MSFCKSGLWAVAEVLLTAAAAAAQTLVIHERTSLKGDDVQVVTVLPAVVTDAEGKRMLGFSPDNASHQSIVDVLAHGMPIRDKWVQGHIAELLDAQPAACRDHWRFDIVIAPVEDLDRVVPNIGQEKRRVQFVSIRNCLAETPKACVFCTCETGVADFGIKSMTAFLENCSAAMHEGVKAGKPWSADVQMSMDTPVCASKAAGGPICPTSDDLLKSLDPEPRSP